MFIKTFLVGLLLAVKFARAYIDRNRDGIQAHADPATFAAVLNFFDAANVLIEFLLGSPVIALGKRVRANSEEYRAVMSELGQQRSFSNVQRRPAQISRDGGQTWQ